MNKFLYKPLDFFKNNIILIFSLIVLVFVIEYYFPGFSSPDCNRQTLQAILSKYRTDHPPIMAYMIHLFMNLFNAKIIYPFFLFQILIYLLGLFLIAKKQKNILAGLIIIIICVLNPLIFRFLGNISKDILMIASYTLFFGIVLYINGFERFKDKILVLFAILFLFLGTASRHNSIFSAFFLIMLLFYRIQYTSVLKLVLRSIIVWILLLLFISFFSNNIIKAQNTRALKEELMFADICSINYMKKTFDFPSFVKFSKEDFYNNYRFSPSAGAFKFIAQTVDTNTAEGIKKYWINMVLENLDVYIHLKSIFFKRMLFNEGEWTSNIRAKIKNKFGGGGFAFLFILSSPFVHALILFIIFFYKLFNIKNVYNNKDDFTVFLLILSGIFYCLPYLIVCPAYDYRYALWYMIVSYISLIWIFCGFFRIKIEKKIVFKYSHFFYIILFVFIVLFVRAKIFDVKIGKIIKHSNSNLEWKFKDKMEDKNYFSRWYKLNLKDHIYNYYKVSAYISLKDNKVILINKKPLLYIHRERKTEYERSIEPYFAKKFSSRIKKESLLGKIQALYLDKKTDTQLKIQYYIELNFGNKNEPDNNIFEIKTTCLYPRIQLPIFSRYFMYDVSEIDIPDNVENVDITIKDVRGNIIEKI